MKEDCFLKSTYVIDFWHLAKNIRACLSMERKELIDEALALACKGEADEILKGLGKLLSHSRDPAFRRNIADLISYVSNNRDGIENAARVDLIALDR